jgi:ketosteroid isomerase-like protein
VLEVDEVGQVIEQWRFDDEDFESAYRQLDQRYYAGEGMAFADAGAVATEYPILLSRGDFDRLYGDLTCPGFRIDDRSRSLFGERSPAEVRATYDELFTRVASLRVWHSAMDWLSPTLVVARFEQDAVGTDGEQFAWCHIDVVEITNGRITSLCLFELDDEEAAFAYAEERMRAASSRLSVTNLARETWDAMVAASQGHDVDAMTSCYAQPFDFDDKRRLGGYPLTDLRAAAEQILAQYKHFAARTLAVRGERLHLGWGRWSNDDGYETAYLFVHEIGEDGRIIYEGRFDEDDFEGAHRELQRRYFAGEGAEFAEMGLVVDELTIAMDRGEFDRILADLTHPAFRLENRSRSIFPDRSASEMTAGFEDMANMVVSTRTWNSALYWLRPSVLVGNFEREATGADGERYAWSGINVAVLRDGKIASVCLFEPSDEDAAFAYADEQVRCAENG